MQLWEFVLTEDRKRDLIDRETLESWAREFREHSLAKGVDYIGDRTRSGNDFGATMFAIAVKKHIRYVSEENWRKPLNAARKLARRLKGFNSRRAEISDLEADEVLLAYTRTLCPEIIRDGPIIRSTGFVRYAPHVSQRLVVDQDDSAKYGHSYDTLFSIFWSYVFGSLAFESFSGVCSNCNEPLGFTRKTHKARRTDLCKKCRDQNRWKQIPIGMRRELNRKKVAKWRAEQKAKSQQGGTP